MVKMTNAALAPIELKSGEDNDAADIVTKAIEDFTATVNERFAAIEKRFENDNSDALGSRLDKIEARLNRPGAPAIITKKEDAAEIERKAFVDYARTGAVDTKALSVAANGAYLVPPVLLNELQKNLVLFSNMRSVARVTAIGVPKVTLPKRTANLTATWVGETATRAESDPTYAQQDFNVYELGVYVDVSNQLLEDSQFPLEAEL
jgi:HK97 family phage major capsid protein